MNAALAMDSGGVAARVHADRLDSRIRNLMEASERQPTPFRVIGQSPEWRQVLTKAAQVAVTNTTVFLQGESGTGKEVVARFIHRASPRKNGPFVAINCAALPAIARIRAVWVRTWRIHGCPSGQGWPI